VSKLTTDVVTYCTEASYQKSKYAYRKILFYKKALHLEHLALFPLTKYQVPWNCGAGALHVLSSIAGFIIVYCHSCWAERHRNGRH